MHEEKVTKYNHYSAENRKYGSDLVITDVREDDAGIYICQINTEPLRNKVTFYQYHFKLFLNKLAMKKITKLIDQP